MAWVERHFAQVFLCVMPNDNKIYSFWAAFHNLTTRNNLASRIQGQRLASRGGKGSGRQRRRAGHFYTHSGDDDVIGANSCPYMNLYKFHIWWDSINCKKFTNKLWTHTCCLASYPRPSTHLCVSLWSVLWFKLLVVWFDLTLSFIRD